MEMDNFIPGTFLQSKGWIDCLSQNLFSVNTYIIDPCQRKLNSLPFLLWMLFPKVVVGEYFC